MESYMNSEAVETAATAETSVAVEVETVSTAPVAKPKPNLTEREKEVLRLVCDGLTNAEIATCLHVSRETVKSELKRIFRKIGVGNRTQAAVLLVRQRWI